MGLLDRSSKDLQFTELRDRELSDVLVIGSSLGGWTAAEMAVRDNAGIITGLVLIDPVGVRVEAEPIRDFFALDARGVAEYSWHDSDRFYVDPADIPAGQLALRQGNMATMRVLAGDPYMHDPKLRPPPGPRRPARPAALGGKRPHRHPRLWRGVRGRLRRRPA
ncbi:hypothetical protein [Nonomuraea sp. NPDC049158]|uniref:hypothetical protein n=1 Tax=Nonomuraea sp. NPDC049158 TaxID=3155649 RepID=UPI003403FCEE